MWACSTEMPSTSFGKHVIVIENEGKEIHDLSDSDLSESEIEAKRAQIRKRLLSKAEKEHKSSDEERDNKDADSDEEEEEAETETESESDDSADEPRLRPVFIPKRDRITIAKKQQIGLEESKREAEKQVAAEERRRETLRLVEQSIKKEQRDERLGPIALALTTASSIEAKLEDVITDDENDEIVYEQWKLRELKRLKRDKDEREQYIREKAEVERLRQLSEEERRNELRLNPKVITNQAVKGKYKFLQKYYHRGAFYLDHEDEVFKRDFSEATLEDHFDKTVLPKVMQVKNFGRSGRTKYTHLVDQDTTKFDNAWCTETPQTLKFFNSQAGGMKQSFNKPSFKRRH